jgi:hypothetical protein
MRYSIFLLLVLCALSGCGGGGSSQPAKLRVINDTRVYDLTVIIGGTTVATGGTTLPAFLMRYVKSTT